VNILQPQALKALVVLVGHHEYQQRSRHGKLKPQVVSLQVVMAAIEANEIYHMVELDEKPEAGR